MLTIQMSGQGTESLGGVPLIRMASWPPVSPMPSKADGAHLQPHSSFGRSWLELAVWCILKFIVYPANIYGVPTEQAEGRLPMEWAVPPHLFLLQFPFRFESSWGWGGVGWGGGGVLGG